MDKANITISRLTRLFDEPLSGFKYVDFMDLNAQGSELSILQGGRQTIQENVLGFDAECNFMPRYHGLPPFGEMDLFANENGFRSLPILSTRKLPSC
jgi:hypothetical protein